MTSSGIASIRECRENAEIIFPIVSAEIRGASSQGSSRGSLPLMPQLPQLPQPKVSARRVIAEDEDEFEERAAILEYDGGMPRPLEEFLAKRVLVKEALSEDDRAVR